MYRDVVMLRMRDNQCPICKNDIYEWSGFEVVFTHEGLELVVEVCRHATQAWRVAIDIIEDNYGELRHCGISKPAMSTGGHYYSWWHLDEEARRCSCCTDEHAPPFNGTSLKLWFVNVLRKFTDENKRFRNVIKMEIGDLPSSFSDEYAYDRLCKYCLRVVSNKFSKDVLTEIRRWHEQKTKWQEHQRQEINERESLAKVKQLIARTKRALSTTADRQDALQSLKKEFEQVATLHK